MTLRNENSNVYLSILSGHVMFSVLSDKPFCEAECRCVWIAFTNKYEKCYREMAYSKAFLVRATQVIFLLVKNDSIDCVLSSFRMDLVKLTSAGSNYDIL
jgi:hypothetical protein